MSQMANTGRRGRTLILLGIAAAIVAITVFRIQPSTILYLGFFLAFPFLMMRMHGGGHGGGFGCGGGHSGSRETDDQTREPGEAPASHRH
jgi:hypothetical protein